MVCRDAPRRPDDPGRGVPARPVDGCATMPSDDLGEPRSGEIVGDRMRGRPADADRRCPGERGRADPSPRELSGDDDLLVSHRRDRHPPGPEHQRLPGHEDLPARRGRQRPRQRLGLRCRLRRRGLRHPLQAEHGRDQAERQAGNAVGLGPPPPSCRLARSGRRADLRLRRGEDDRDDAAGLWVPGEGDRGLGRQPDAPQPRPVRQPAGLPDLGDRLGPADDPGSHRHHGDESPLDGRRRVPAGLPGLRRREGLRPQRRRQVRVPGRGPRRPLGPRLRGAQEDQQRADVDGPGLGRDARLHGRPPPSGRQEHEDDGRP